MSCRRTAVAVSLLLLTATGLRAQRLERRFSPVPLARSAPVTASSPGESARGTRHTLLNTVLYGAGGAILGGWVGYMTSQVVWSDWQNISRPGGVNRMHYTLTGAGLGAIAGALLGHHVGAGAAPPPGRRRTPWGDLPVISPQEIRASSARSAGELVRRLRPGWLSPQGTDTFGGAVVQTYTTEGVAVYVDGTPLGNVADLEGLPIVQVVGVEYYDLKAATERWGVGHLNAAINVLTNRGGSAEPAREPRPF